MESNYQFRKRLEVVHKPNRRNLNALKSHDELEITEDWRIIISESASELILHTAKDLQDYFLTSMNISVRISKVIDVQEAARERDNIIILASNNHLQLMEEELTKPRSYRITVSHNKIIVCGSDDRGTAQGSYYLEDQMNIREAPVLKFGEITREPLFSPRMAHSGWGLDHFPDAHLNAMAHAGIDAVLVFVKDIDQTPTGYKDFNHLVDRAALYGLDVYVYSYLISRFHPDDPDAPAYYNSTYGKLFQACPRFKGVILVGESCEFPSKDPNTTGKLLMNWPADQPRTKPSPGWWPCEDFPQWLDLLSKTIRSHSPDADIVFWTYNWGYAPEEERLKLIRNLPNDITLLVTFEMFEQVDNEDVAHVAVDYTLSQIGPGQYFRSEAEAAHERGLKLYTMSNTGGLTWDIGVIPYEPFPMQWNKRHKALLHARDQWGLSGLMENHHYGWWPSFISDLTKYAYWTPSPSFDEVLTLLAERDFGKAASTLVLETWGHWSEAIENYICTSEDQYGPFRVGPSYPLVFLEPIKMPASKHAMMGNEIIITDYKPRERPAQSLGINRIDVEIRSLERMLSHMKLGNDLLENGLALTPGNRREDAARMLDLGSFIACCVQTTIHVKQWWMLKQRLLLTSDHSEASALLVQLEQLAEREIANAEAAIPLVEADSRLGWEPSMEYMTDTAHIKWKIAQVRSVLDREFIQYKSSMALTGLTGPSR
ncbi:hypothetical protein [Paenibacillus agaridevorans]|uniref:hypothetical protein n=1 Tax=Paenibacillus agaridevorans TaxID=171404 RepID=UPI001BE4990A|nr:hypothetical protein [Paenibacillus agaridevorans]